MSNISREKSEAAKSPPSGSRWLAVLSILLGLAATATVAINSPNYGFAIDEATYIWVAREERDWFSQLDQRPVAESLSREALAERMHFLESPFDRPVGKHSNFNLPAAMHLMNVGWVIGHRFLDELHADRLGSAILFGITVGSAVWVLGACRGPICGLAAGGFLIACPRLFGHAHFAATETPLSCFWLLSCVYLYRATWREAPRTGGNAVRPIPWKAVMAFGLCIGLLFATKITGWLIAGPLLVWAIVQRSAGVWKLACIGVVCAVILPYALTPPLWREPIASVVRLVKLSADNPWKIPSMYFGTAYGAGMPWHSGFVLFAITVPIATLLLGFVGLMRSRRDSLALLISLNAATLLAARTIGLMPNHDGERQFLPLFAFWATLAALGVDAAIHWIVRVFRFDRSGRSLAKAAVVVTIMMAALAEPVLETWRFRHHGLSYYNRLIGGLAGADLAGMEVSYWFEAATDDVWRAALAKIPNGGRVFLRPDHPGLDYLTERGIWRPDLKSVGPNDADFFLLYRRKAAYAILDPATGNFVVTDLLKMQQAAPASWESQRFEGIRWLALFDRRR